MRTLLPNSSRMEIIHTVVKKNPLVRQQIPRPEPNLTEIQQLRVYNVPLFPIR